MRVCCGDSPTLCNTYIIGLISICLQFSEIISSVLAGKGIVLSTASDVSLTWAMSRPYQGVKPQTFRSECLDSSECGKQPDIIWKHIPVLGTEQCFLLSYCKLIADCHCTGEGGCMSWCSLSSFSGHGMPIQPLSFCPVPLGLSKFEHNDSSAALMGLYVWRPCWEGRGRPLPRRDGDMRETTNKGVLPSDRIIL